MSNKEDTSGQLIGLTSEFRLESLLIGFVLGQQLLNSFGLQRH